MEPLKINKLCLFPIIMFLWNSIGMIICFLIALHKGHASVYVPFISEIGGKLPESGIFVIVLTFEFLIGAIIVLIRYMVISKINNGLKKIDIVNKIALVIGFISFCGMLLAAIYSMYSIPIVHYIGARIFFIGQALYGILQILLFHWTCKKFDEIVMFWIRFVMCFLSIISYISLLIMYPIGSNQWIYDFPEANKIPGNQGFSLILWSSVCEWLMVNLFLLFMLTFTKEFRQITINVSLTLNGHMDDQNGPCETRETGC
ncbi:DNA damage-regulated autophagy modulator protein 1-like [Centruroides vittatus]|uniref:DNA damage-regulated autophagy modulator protein 1-like n=1 Tax=Centruroides vittatus TaxID=120091 RepID=UPI0035101CFA